MLDASHLGHGPDMSDHLGFHVDNLELFINHDEFRPLLREFQRKYVELPSDKDKVNCLIVDPYGTKRAVGVSALLQYIVRSIPVCCAWPQIRHFSDHNWNNHLDMCTDCKMLCRQPRFDDVCKVAVQKFLNLE